MTAPDRGPKVPFIVVGIAAFAALYLMPSPDPARPEVGHTLAVAVLMALFWITEAIPMAATALIPVVLFPLLGVVSAKAIAPLYINDIIFLFIGGFLLATAMEQWGLHRRIALRIMMTVGKNPARLLFAVMAVSWLLSGWVSNTATTLMMTPIVVALASRFEEKGAARTFAIAMLLGVAYASSLGGMSTLIGTAPNLSLAKIYAVSFPQAPELTFFGWMSFAMPVAFVLLILTFVYLRIVLVKNVRFDIEESVLAGEYQALGKPTFEEKAVLVTFIAFVLLIVTRSDISIGDSAIRGWASRVGVAGTISDGTVSVAVAMLLYLIPSRSQPGGVLGLDAIARLPWDIILLLGGGFALAYAFQTSGLSEYVGGRLAGLKGVHPIVIVAAVCTLITFLTELTSNTATTQVVLPIIAAMCVELGIHPLFLMVPVTISASCAFMLPVATPPNAIVFGTHRIAVNVMARTGFALNLIGIIVITLMMYFAGRVVFGIDLTQPPSWML